MKQVYFLVKPALFFVTVHSIAKALNIYKNTYCIPFLAGRHKASQAARRSIYMYFYICLKLFLIIIEKAVHRNILHIFCN